MSAGNVVSQRSTTRASGPSGQVTPTSWPADVAARLTAIRSEVKREPWREAATKFVPSAAMKTRLGSSSAGASGRDLPAAADPPSAARFRNEEPSRSEPAPILAALRRKARRAGLPAESDEPFFERVAGGGLLLEPRLQSDFMRQ